MKPHHKMALIIALYCIFLLWAHHLLSYQILVRLMSEWNWLLSGLSAGGFAVFFNWLISRKKNSNHKKALISFVLIELYMNYSQISNCMEILHAQRNTSFRSFINKHEWDNARQTLTYTLPTGIITDIDFAYRCHQLLEDKLLRSNFYDINRLINEYNELFPITQNAISYLNREINEDIELPPPIDFTQR